MRFRICYSLKKSLGDVSSCLNSSRLLLIAIIALIFLLPLPLHSFASAITLEKDIQMGLEKSLVIARKLETRLSRGEDVSGQINELKKLAADISLTHLLVKERFSLRAESLNSDGRAGAIDRHRVMNEAYLQAIDKYLSIVESLQPATPNPQPLINSLRVLLESILPAKKQPIFGSLPNRIVAYPAREPDPATSITPAYKGGDHGRKFRRPERHGRCAGNRRDSLTGRVHELEPGTDIRIRKEQYRYRVVLGLHERGGRNIKAEKRE